MNRIPPLRTLVALAQVVLVAATFAWLSRTIVVPALAVLAALAGAYGWCRPLKLIPWLGLGLTLSLAFMAKWFFWPADPRDLFVSVPQVLGEYMLMAQAVQLLVTSRDRPLGPSFLLIGVGALLTAGLVRVNSIQWAVYQVAVLLFVLLTLFHAALDRPIQRAAESRRSRLRAVMLGLLLLVSCVSSVAGSMLVQRKWSAIESFLNERYRGRTNWVARGNLGMLRFARRKQSGIGSVDLRDSEQEDQIALRVSGNGTPQYLRGGGFDRYMSNGGSDERWSTSSEAEKRPATKLIPGNLPALQPGERPFVIRRVAEPLPQVLELWAEVESDTLFTQLNTSAIAAPVDAVRIDDHDTVETSEFPPGQGYRIFGFQHSERAPITREQREELTEVPPQLRKLLDEFGAEIFKDRKTPQDKIAAVKDYFDQHYQYSLVVDVPRGESPMEYFLRKKPAAHCEFFASATTLLLRTQGVPTRYVYGYYGGNEYNPLGRYWIIRQKNAHAWTEAYIDGEGWQVVETTPATALHDSQAKPHVSHLWDNLLLKLRMVRALLSRGGGRATLQAAWILFSALFTTLPGLLVTTILSIILWRLLRPLWRRRGAVVESVSPGVRDLRKLLARVERRLGRRNLQRGPGETLHQFANRLREAAQEDRTLQPVIDWYFQYAEVRYGTDLDSEQVLKLKGSADALPV